MQKTLIILKPDCMTNKDAGKVISRFETQGFEIVAFTNDAPKLRAPKGTCPRRR